MFKVFSGLEIFLLSGAVCKCRYFQSIATSQQLINIAYGKCLESCFERLRYDSTQRIIIIVIFKCFISEYSRILL